MIDLVFLIPLCVVVSFVYEATHTEDMSLILRKGLRLSITLTGGIILFAAALYLLDRFVL